MWVYSVCVWFSFQSFLCLFLPGKYGPPNCVLAPTKQQMSARDHRSHRDGMCCQCVDRQSGGPAWRTTGWYKEMWTDLSNATAARLQSVGQDKQGACFRLRSNSPTRERNREINIKMCLYSSYDSRKKKETALIHFKVRHISALLQETWKKESCCFNLFLRVSFLLCWEMVSVVFFLWRRLCDDLSRSLRGIAIADGLRAASVVECDAPQYFSGSARLKESKNTSISPDKRQRFGGLGGWRGVEINIHAKNCPLLTTTKCKFKSNHLRSRIHGIILREIRESIQAKLIWPFTGSKFYRDLHSSHYVKSNSGHV